MCKLSATEEKNELRKAYFRLLFSGMFWEFHPELTGSWEKDKDAWMKIQKELEEFRATLKKESLS